VSDIHTEDDTSTILNTVNDTILAASILQNQKAGASKSSTMEIKPPPLEVRTQPATTRPISTFLILKHNNSHPPPPIKPDSSYPQGIENHEEINESNLKLKAANKIEKNVLDNNNMEISRYSYNYELRGPVRAALWASGPEQREALRLLEKEFGDSHNIPPSSTTPLCSLINAGPDFNPHSDPDFNPHSDPNPHLSPDPSPPLKAHDDRNLDNNRDLQPMREGRLYTACMTNPPFYDTEELVNIC
jgi:hypothetical protein